jgi:Zn-dependent peptidase ImmA (M78 family)
MLEDNGVRVIEMEAPEEFDGLSTYVGNIPVVVINKNYSVERKRFTGLHELGHLVLSIEEGADKERICHAFAGALLLPDDCLEKLIGEKRSNIAPGELVSIKEQFGISVQAVMMRAQLKGIIDKNAAGRFWKSMAGNRKEEGLGSYAGREKSYRFEHLVFRLAAEDVVSMSKAANLAGIKLATFKEQLDALA